MSLRATISQMTLPVFQLPPSAADAARIQLAYANDGATSCEARMALEQQYAALLTPTDEFNRRLVSYQANKQARLHNWLKYKEGFSAQLVDILLSKFGVQAGQKILEPFAGSATTLLVAKELGIDAVGIEILPVCHLAWEAKSQYRQYDIPELQRVRHWLKVTTPGLNEVAFPHVTITHSAFTPDQEAKLMWYRDQFDRMAVSRLTKLLLRLILMSVLEEISFTRKDGQYLRWDARSEKVQTRNAQRTAKGRAPVKVFDKGRIVDVRDALSGALDEVIRDLEVMQQNGLPASQQELIKGTVLEVLPQLADQQFDVVITSPPYCNRYDYTRTYALELAFLGVDDQGIKDLRQSLLSCTVENRSKLHELGSYYTALGRSADFDRVKQALDQNAALQEVFAALHTRGLRGELNNQGVIRMVEGYFTELAFVIFELQRACRSQAHVAIVNDNVRYGGEIIPVDLLMTDLAASFGFRPEIIYVLPQRKGNSSQQMGKYGREANRKSITVWARN